MIFDRTFKALETTLDFCLLRHSVISDNIANAETPGFKARRVHFERELAKAVDETAEDTSALQVSPTIEEDPRNEVGQDRNTVDMDREMAELAKNDVKYSATSQTISKKFALLKYAILEGER